MKYKHGILLAPFSFLKFILVGSRTCVSELKLYNKSRESSQLLKTFTAGVSLDVVLEAPFDWGRLIALEEISGMSSHLK